MTRESRPRTADLLRVSLAALSLIALAGCAPAAETTEIQNESPQEDDAASVQTDEAPTSAELHLPAGLSDEELADVVMERLTAWRNAGESENLRTDRLDANLDWESFLPSVAADNRQLFGEALLVEGWQSDANLSEFAANLSEINLSTLLIFVNSEWNGDEKPENRDGYERYIEATAVTGEDRGEGERTLAIAYAESDNAASNYVPEDQLANSGPITGTYTFRFVVVDGTERIASYQLIGP